MTRYDCGCTAAGSLIATHCPIHGDGIMTPPTSAAMRAARNLPLPWGDIPDCRLAEVAAIIDRETGLPELLATLRAARSMLANLDDREFFSVEAAKELVSRIDFVLG